MIDSPSVRRVVGLLLLGAVFVCLLLSIQRVPEWQTKRASVRSAVVNPEAKTTPADVAALQNEMRKTYLQVVGGAFALFALYLTFRRVKVAEQGHITDRYSKAIELLGALNAKNEPNVEVRLGAIYALERIAFDSPRDHWTIMEVLTAYVRQNAPAPAQGMTKQEQEKDAQDTITENEGTERKIAKKPATEIQAILTVLKRRKRGRKREGKEHQLDLSHSDLRGEDFVEAHLDGALFIGAYLDKADFMGAHLDGAHFFHAHLDGTKFGGAHLEYAGFYKAHLDGALFIGAYSDKASFREAHLDGAWFHEAHLDRAVFDRAHLAGVMFNEAHLERAWFNGAHLERAWFNEAHVQGAYFGGLLNGKCLLGAFGLTVEQFANSVGVDQAYFDEAFRRELEAAKEAAIKAAAGNDTTPKDTHPTEE